MKCRFCGAPTDVILTRSPNDWTTRRRRQCFNGHRFTTLEVMDIVASSIAYRNREAVKTTARRVEITTRNKRILDALAKGRLSKQIAIDEKVSETTVSRVKAMANGTQAVRAR